ncbi:hypothetical protein ACQJBY_005562 [Aegilops geniculata]
MHRSLPRERHRTEGSCRNARRIDFANKIYLDTASGASRRRSSANDEAQRQKLHPPSPCALSTCTSALPLIMVSRPEWDVCWIFACRQYHGVPYEVGRKRRTRWPLCFTDIVDLFCKCKKMKQICRLLQLSEMGKRLWQGKDTSRTH